MTLDVSKIAWFTTLNILELNSYTPNNGIIDDIIDHSVFGYVLDWINEKWEMDILMKSE